jgi:hypothetical protein
MNNEMSVSDEAVEVAARALAVVAWGEWEYVPTELRGRMRWGVSWRDITAVYDTEAEARAQLNLAQMDVPATLVVDDGNGWMVAE